MKCAASLVLCGFLLLAAEPVKQVFDDAARALAAGDYDAAERGFQAVLKQEPRNVSALGNLGILYARTNRADKAIAFYGRALKLSPDDQALLLNLGLVYFRQDAHAKALPLFARVVALNPNNLQARQLLAVCRLYGGEPAPAIRELESLRARRPRDGGILFLLGFAYLKNRQPDKAKAVFADMFQAVGPARAQFLIGRSYYEATVFDQAEKNFLETLRLDPTFPGIHLELGKVYISERKTEDAFRELRQALKDKPGDPDASYFLGGLLVQQEQYAEAIPYLERALETKGDFWAPYFYLGKAEFRLGRQAEGIRLLQRAAQLNPDEATVYYVLGQALQSAGRREEALQAIERVRELRAGGREGAAPDDSRVVGTR